MTRPGRAPALAVVTLGLALLALAAPLGRAEFPTPRVGWLLAFASAIEMLHAMRRSEASARRRAAVGAIISMAIALFLINAPFVASQALRWLIAGWFGVDGVRHAIGAARRSDANERRHAILSALGNGAVALLLVFSRGGLLEWIVAAAGALRIFGIAWSILAAPVYATSEADETVIDELGLSDSPAAVAMAAEVNAAEHTRAPIDRGWTIAFIATLFAIHIGRMRTDLTFLGMISPAVAVLGDMTIAILVTLLVINPVYLLWRGPTRWIERTLWRRQLGRDDSTRAGRIARLTDGWLRWRLRWAIRMRAARYSVPKALGLGLQTGLPIAAIVAATVPVWGMSWYFDTENWAAGMWNSWAESRTDTWREAMVRTVGSSTFAVQPPGVGAGDFSFVVIGDPGEGDASQHILRDQILAVANHADVRFVVISSDVVYPTGSMNDYEAKFFLPFKGVTRPILAIPGNHDWYDALEGFAATFLQADAARASIRARVESDLRLTSTTEDRIDGLIREAERLRTMYGVPTGFQRAPFFEIQTDRFALVAIDTGILRTIDAAQAEWLQAALNRSAGKFTMAILGHPFFAGGHDLTAGDVRVRAAPEAARGSRRLDRHGRRHARSRVLQRAGSDAPGRSSRRQWRGRRVHELRHGARLARAPADDRLGVLPEPRGRDRENPGEDALVETPGVVVDEAFRRLAVHGGMAVGGLRLQRRAVLSELHRSESRAVREPRPPDSLRRQRPAHLG